MTRPGTPRMLALGCPRWSIVVRDLAPDAPSAVFSANRVTSASPEAVACGVRRGMRRREAQARCPEMEILDHDPVLDARSFEPIVAVVESFSPRVEIVRPGLCVTPARGPTRYFGGEHVLRTKLAEAVDEALAGRRRHPLHIDDRSRVGIADGPFAATLAAVRGEVVEPGQSQDFLASFGVDVLGTPELADLLRRLGIDTLGTLAALPVDKVVARFGIDGAIAHRLARGTDDRLLELRDIPPELTVTREIDPPAHRVDVASFVGKSAADELVGRLGELGLACARIAITAATEHGEERTRVWRHSAAFTSAAIAERVRWQLDGWLNEEVLSGGIAVLQLHPLDVGAATGAQAKLWGRRTDVSDAVRRAVARVQGLLGPEGAHQAGLSGGRHPSEQASFVPWGETVEARRPGLPGEASVQGPVSVELPPWPGRLPSPAPALVLERPRPVEVIDADGRSVGVTGRGVVEAEPARVHLHPLGPPSRRIQGWHDVVAWSGPWPVDERWWDAAEHHRRARFQIVLDDGTAHLLALEGGRWHLEATYD